MIKGKQKIGLYSMAAFHPINHRFHTVKSYNRVNKNALLLVFQIQKQATKPLLHLLETSCLSLFSHLIFIAPMHGGSST